MMVTNVIHNEDVRTGIRKLPKESIDCVMTSPPYWALRDYGVEGQLGLEPTFDEYIQDLCDIFENIQYILKKEGTCWVNLGDTYSSHKDCKSTAQTIAKGTSRENAHVMEKGISQSRNSKMLKEQGMPDKSLVMIPFRFAIEMVNRGWILRNTIIWHKRNCMPSSVKDRFTVDFEYLFFFSKSKNYYFETQYEPVKTWDKTNRDRDATKLNNTPGRTRMNGLKTNDYRETGRNKRTVWTINPKPFPDAHFAVYPEELCETPIKSGCPKGGIVLDPFIGSGTTALVALKQQKKFIGFELNKEYIEIAMRRLRPYLEQKSIESYSTLLTK